MNKKGVTLLELVVVIVIVGIGTALVAPNVGRLTQRYKLKAAAREVANFLVEARTEAIKKADFAAPVRYRVVFDQAQGTFKRQIYQSGAWSDETAARSLPPGITIYSLSPTDINTRYFLTDGSSVLDLDADPTNDNFDSTAAIFRIQLQDSKGDHFQVNLYSLTGISEVQEGWSS